MRTEDYRPGMDKYRRRTWWDMRLLVKITKGTFFVIGLKDQQIMRKWQKLFCRGSRKINFLNNVNALFKGKLNSSGNY